MTERLRSGSFGYNNLDPDDSAERVADEISKSPMVAKIHDPWGFGTKPRKEPSRGPRGEVLRAGLGEGSTDDGGLSKWEAEKVADAILKDFGHVVDKRPAHERYRDR